MLPVAKHHDGFCMWNCSATAPGWNAVDTGPKRDVLTELYDAVTATDNVSFGIYFSQGEWFDANFVRDHNNNFTTAKYVDKMQAQRLDLVTRFPKSVIWHTDGYGLSRVRCRFFVVLAAFSLCPSLAPVSLCKTREM